MLYLQSKTKQKSNHNACAHLLKLKNCYQKMGFIKKSFKYTKKNNLITLSSKNKYYYPAPIILKIHLDFQQKKTNYN